MNHSHGQLASADPEMMQEIVREAESYLTAQLSASIAADQRAVSFASLLAAATVIIAGAGGSLLLATPPEPYVGWICIGIAAAFLVAMALAIRAAMPADFWYVGNSPAQWLADASANRPLIECLAEQVEHYADMIVDNDRLMRRNNKQLRAALWVAWAGLVAGGAGAIVYLAIRLYA